MERSIFPLSLLCLVCVSGVGGIRVTIPQVCVREYEVACGDNVTLPCSFQSTLPNPQLVIITWAVHAEKEILVLAHYYPQSVTDVNRLYEHRVTLDVDVAEGKANLNLTSATLQDGKVYECRVMIPGDDEGIPTDTTRLVVRGCE